MKDKAQTTCSDRLRPIIHKIESLSLHFTVHQFTGEDKTIMASVGEPLTIDDIVQRTVEEAHLSCSNFFEYPWILLGTFQDVSI